MRIRITAVRKASYPDLMAKYRAVLKEVISRPPYDGAKDYFYISDVDDREYLTALIKATIPVLPPNGRVHKFK